LEGHTKLDQFTKSYNADFLTIAQTVGDTLYDTEDEARQFFDILSNWKIKGKS